MTGGGRFAVRARATMKARMAALLLPGAAERAEVDDPVGGRGAPLAFDAVPTCPGAPTPQHVAARGAF